MKVIDVSFFYDEVAKTTFELYQQHYTTLGCTDALNKKGIDIIVIKRFKKNELLIQNSIPYHFIRDNFKGKLKVWQIPFNVFMKIKKLQPDVVQLHGFMFPLQVLLLRFFLNKKTVICIQHHAGKPSNGIKGTLYNLMNNVADIFFFTTTTQGLEWFPQKGRSNKIMPLMEGSTTFKKQDKIVAKTITELKGNPIFLWVGRLNENKDPITVLNGFETIAQTHADSSLYMIYLEDELLELVTNKIQNSATLKNAVHLLSRLEQPKLEAYYNSADYFVLGSHEEGSGYALNEALACGCIPIVTDIPSFRMMTNNGKLGALWQSGNSQSFVDAATIAMKKDCVVESNACVKFFNEQLSFDAIAQQTIQHYETAISKRIKH
jgi:glycosyltransferase involved in cell wall biosynthesis